MEIDDDVYLSLAKNASRYKWIREGASIGDLLPGDLDRIIDNEIEKGTSCSELVGNVIQLLGN